MRIEHIAVWADDLELLRSFYIKYFGMSCGRRYDNPANGFSSYFLSFGEDGARIELMHVSGVVVVSRGGTPGGLAHFAVSVGSKEAVDRLTAQLESDGHTVIGKPRTTGDGYYESVVADPEGNRVEITV